MTDKPRKATVIAKGRVKLATLGKKAFDRLLGPCLDIIKRNVSNYETVYQKVMKEERMMYVYLCHINLFPTFH